MFDAATGQPHYQLQRLDASEVFASPVGAAGRVYITSRDGKTTVLKHGKTFEVLGVNTLSDGFDASPALVDNEMFMRVQEFLDLPRWKLARKPEGRSQKRKTSRGDAGNAEVDDP